jgi:hypothetical protein
MTDCAICLDPVDAKMSGRVETTCNHVFHPKCLWKWYSSQKIGSCPSCRGAATELGDIERGETGVGRRLLQIRLLAAAAPSAVTREALIREIAAEINRLAIELDSLI